VVFAPFSWHSLRFHGWRSKPLTGRAVNGLLGNRGLKRFKSGFLTRNLPLAVGVFRQFHQAIIRFAAAAEVGLIEQFVEEERVNVGIGFELQGGFANVFRLFPVLAVLVAVATIDFGDPKRLVVTLQELDDVTIALHGMIVHGINSCIHPLASPVRPFNTKGELQLGIVFLFGG
jgi:hypothetical protein